MPLLPILNQGETRWFAIIKKLRQFIARRLSGQPVYKASNGIESQKVYNGIRSIQVARTSGQLLKIYNGLRSVQVTLEE